MSVQPSTTARTVHRFDLDPTGAPTTLAVHGASRLVHTALVRTKRGPQVRVWVEHDPAAVAAPRTFQLIATGAPLPPFAAHAGVVQVGARAVHVYELAAGTLPTVPDDLSALLGPAGDGDDSDDSDGDAADGTDGGASGWPM